MGSGKAVVAMSGGVDSSVAACLLHEQGYEVIGLFMRVGATVPEQPAATGQPARQGCCSASDAGDARFVAGLLGIGFYALNFKDDFERIIDYFVDEYGAGRTPNPCVVCNHDLKFGKLLDYADAVGADLIATGHYARIETRDGRRRLCKAADERKDQSYVLFGLDRAVLDRMLLPIGHLTKEQVRREAVRFGLPVCDKPDSVEICFVPDRDYARLVHQRRPEAFRPGEVVNADGAVLGRHEGLPNFTIGQRRGLGIAAGRPIYVTRLNVLDNTVTVGDRTSLLSRTFTASGLNFLVDPPPAAFRAEVKIRYHHRAAPATVQLRGEDTALVTFDEPQSAITPGQAAVFYEGDAVLGGGWIEECE
ncbi:MAG: tRNA 2-thiouridine(34) synthase MnmA [Planctomycetota bacterium]|jgi:tRNA-specific 2-thiouridylase